MMPRLIDLFCGAGGMSLGFVQAGFKPVWANDINADAVQTYEANFGPHCELGDLSERLLQCNDLPKADVVVGGPPCQGFSLLNKGREGDLRRQLWRPFMEVVRRSGANSFVMENVPQILGSEEYDEIVGVAIADGFQVTSAKLVAADYGVAQTRTRAVIFGSRIANPNLFFPPVPTHRKPPLAPELSLEEPCYWRTVRDAISDLPIPVGTEIRQESPPLDLHFGRTPTPTSVARYKAIPEQGMNREDLFRIAPELTPQCWVNKKGGTDLFGRLWWDRPAFTIRTEFFKPEKGRYLHPEQNRPLTHREAARLQGFPDTFIFCGSKIEIARQIGNAVPPPLANAIAGAVLRTLVTK